MKAFAANVALATLLGLGRPAAGQVTAPSPAEAPRTITLDVRATDPLGRPVAAVTPADVVVEIDGHLRPVASVTYVNFGAAPAVPDPAAEPGAAAAPADLNSRAILIVIDDLSFEGSLPAQVADDLSRWLVALGPRDVVGFATTSGRALMVEPTRDRAAVLGALRAPLQGRRRAGDDAERVASEQINAMHDLIRRLHRVQGTRVVIVLSAGIATAAVDPEPTAALRRVSGHAGSRLYAIAPIGQPAPGPAGGPIEALQLVAAAGGGRLMRITDSATAALSDVLADVPGTFRLVVESPTQAPEAPYRFVKVTARDVATLMETATRVLAPEVEVADAVVQDRVRSILRDGEPAFGVAVDSVGVVGRDDVPNQVRLLNTVTVPESTAGPITMTFVVLDEAGVEVKGGTGRIGDAVAGELRTSFATSLAPGRYRLRVAAVDGAGRIGTTERSVVATLRSVGAFTAGDPQLVWRVEAPPWYLVSRGHVPATAQALAVGLELVADPARSGAPPPVVTFSLVTEDGRHVAGRDLTAVPMAGGWRVSSEVALETLPPGGYDVSLAIRDEGREPIPVVAFVRRGSTTASGRVTPPSRDEFLALFQADVRTMWPRFSAAATVTSGVARRLIQEFATDAGRPVPASLGPAASADVWVANLAKVAAGADAFGSLARAMLSLVKGELAAADTSLAEARKAVPDSVSVEILTGALHAAANRDQEAIRAWRDAIGTLAADPDWSLPLAEALGRTGDFAGALEALSLLPRDPSRIESVRAVDAAIALGRYAEARAAADKGRAGTGAYQGRLAFYALVFAYADALAPDASDAVKRAFTDAADRYVKAGGELAPLVNGWIASLK